MDIEVKVHPGSSQKKVTFKEGIMHLSIHARPEKGKANKEAVDLLSDHFDLPVREIVLKSGEKSRNKVFSIASLAPGRLPK